MVDDKLEQRVERVRHTMCLNRASIKIKQCFETNKMTIHHLHLLLFPSFGQKHLDVILVDDLHLFRPEGELAAAQAVSVVPILLPNR